MKMGPDTAGRVRSGAEVVALTVGGGVEGVVGLPVWRLVTDN